MVALVERANLYARTGRPELALADFSEALHLYPTMELVLTRGHLQEELGRLDAAASGYLEGLKLLPHASILRQELIRVRTAQGRYSEALTLIEQELASARSKPSGTCGKLRCWLPWGRPKPEIKPSRSPSLKPTSLRQRPTALHQVARAKVYQALGELEAAKQELRLAVQSAPHYSEAQEFLKQLEAQ